MRFDGSSYFFDTEIRVATTADVTERAVFDQVQSTAELVIIGHSQAGWDTLVIKDVGRPSGPTAYALNYSSGMYTELLSNGNILSPGELVTSIASCHLHNVPQRLSMLNARRRTSGTLC